MNDHAIYAGLHLADSIRVQYYLCSIYINDTFPCSTQFPVSLSCSLRMSKLFFLAWIISISYVALSMERHCAEKVCSICHKHDSSCSNVTCSDYGKCSGSLTHDHCGCCIVCAKQEGESCAGPHGVEGFCDAGLKCNVSEKKAVAGKVDKVGVCKGKS